MPTDRLVQHDAGDRGSTDTGEIRRITNRPPLGHLLGVVALGLLAVIAVVFAIGRQIVADAPDRLAFCLWISGTTLIVCTTTLFAWYRLQDAAGQSHERVLRRQAEMAMRQELIEQTQREILGKLDGVLAKVSGSLDAAYTRIARVKELVVTDRTDILELRALVRDDRGRIAEAEAVLEHHGDQIEFVKRGLEVAAEQRKEATGADVRSLTERIAAGPTTGINGVARRRSDN